MKQILVILILAACAGVANAQQTLFVPVCTGNATPDTTRIESLKTAIGSTTATITPPYKANPSQACTWNNVTIPFNITLDFTNGTAVKYAGNVHILGPVVNPTGKTIFTSAGGSLSFSGNSFVGTSGQPKLTNGQGVENYGNPAPGGAAGGELTGTYPNPTVVTGTTANKIVRLDGAGKLPAVDASQLLNIPGGTPCGLNAQLQFNNNGVCGATSGGTATPTQVTLNDPQILTGIYDSSNHQLVKLNQGGVNAINWIELTSAPGTQAPMVSSGSGSNATIDLNVAAQGGGTVNLYSNTQVAGRLMFGGTTNAFPALKPDATATSFLAARLGDNSGATGITASIFRTANGSQLSTFHGLDIASTHSICFKAGTDPAVSDFDTSIYRESAGVLAVTDCSGTPTNYRDLKVRNLYLSSPTGNIITLKAPSSGTPIYTWPSGFVAGQYMKVDALGNLSFGTPAGAGDVVGPGSATASALACFDGTSGKLIKDCGLTLSGTNTGDQNLFGSIVVSGQTTITPNSTNTALTVVAGSNITLTTDNTAKSVTIAASAGGGGGLPDCGGNGYAVRSALNTSVCRTLQGTANQIAITNPTGVAGDSVFSIPTAAQLNVAKITNLTSNGFVKTGSGDGALSVDTGTYLTANQSITVSGDVSGSGTTAITATIGANKVLDAMLRQSPARSVIGRAGSTTGNVTDITATGSSGAVLRESGNSIGFGTVATAGIADAAITYAKIQNVTASKLLGRNDSGAGPPVEITLGGGLVMSGSTLSASASVPAQTGLLGTVKLSAAPTDAANPVAVVTEDVRVNIERVIGEFANFATALSTIGSTPTTLVINTTTTSGNATVPATLALRFTQAGKISVNSGAVFTLQTGKIIADLNQQIFAATNTNTGGGGTGKVEFTGEYPTTSSVMWWGAKADGGTTDNLTPINAAIASFNSPVPGDGTGFYFRGGVLEFPSSDSYYKVGGTIDVYRPLWIKGASASVSGGSQVFSTQLRFSVAATGFVFHRYNTLPSLSGTVADGAKLSNLEIVGTYAGNTGTANVSALAVTKVTGPDYNSDFNAGYTIRINGYDYMTKETLSSSSLTIRKPRLNVAATNGSPTVSRNDNHAWPNTDWNGQGVLIDGVAYTISTNNTTTITLTGNYTGTTGNYTAEVQAVKTLTGVNTTLNKYHGVQTYAQITIEDVTVSKFSGHGFAVDTSTAPSAAPSVTDTNANNSKFVRINSLLNRGNGFFARGENSNNMTVGNVDATNNNGAGIYDASLLGNLYSATHTSFDQYGAQITIGAGNTTFLHAYQEGGQPTSYYGPNTSVIGGTNGAEFANNAEELPQTVGVPGPRLTEDGGLWESTPLRMIRRANDNAPGSPAVSVGVYLGSTTRAYKDALELTSSDDTASTGAGGTVYSPQPVYHVTYGAYGTGWWSLNYNDPAGSDPTKQLMAFSGSQASGGAAKLRFPNGFTAATTSGSVGINTTSPGAKLDINGAFTALNSNTDLLMGATNRNSFAQIGQDATHNLFVGWSYNATATSAYGDVHAYGGSNPLVLQVAGGNVGIGIASPQSQLHMTKQFTIDPTNAYTVINFGATVAALNIVGDINGSCSNGINQGVHVVFRQNDGETGTCGPTSGVGAYYGALDSGNSRSKAGGLEVINFLVQDFPTIANGANNWTITSATNTSPVEFTMTSPPGVPDGFSTGYNWTIQGATLGWTAINGSFPITVTASNKFTIPVNSTSFGALSGTVKTCYVCATNISIGRGGEIEVGTGNPTIDDPYAGINYPGGTQGRMNGLEIESGVGQGQTSNAIDNRPTAAIVIADEGSGVGTAYSQTWFKTGLYMAQIYNRGVWFHTPTAGPYRNADLDTPFKIAMIDADAPTANIIKGESGRTITNGIDISAMTVSGNAFASPGIKITGSGDVGILTSGKGVILKSPNGTCYRATVDNAGVISTASLTCP